MYEAYKGEDKPVTIQISWDQNTARGFAIALAMTAVVLIFMTFLEAVPVKAYKNPYQQDSISVIELRWGAGDGTGGSKGNLTREGKKQKGGKPQDILDDAEKAAKNKGKNRHTEDVLNVPADVSTIDETSSTGGDEKSDGTGARKVGDPDGSDDGTGLGLKGTGKGKGLGLGDIEWGGGGNRIVSYKPKRPSYPQGVNIRDAEIKIKFFVDPNGNVINAQPLSKVDPVLERVAIQYVKRFKFNPLPPDKRVNMVGSIRVVFRKR